MIREAVSNALKHGAGSIRVTAEIANGRLMMGISNEFAGTDAGDDAGIGLANIAARAAELGGKAETMPRDGRFVVSLALPLPKVEA